MGMGGSLDRVAWERAGGIVWDGTVWESTCGSGPAPCSHSVSAARFPHLAATLSTRICAPALASGARAVSVVASVTLGTTCRAQPCNQLNERRAAQLAAKAYCGAPQASCGGGSPRLRLPVPPPARCRSPGHVPLLHWPPRLVRTRFTRLPTTHSPVPTIHNAGRPPTSQVHRRPRRDCRLHCPRFPAALHYHRGLAEICGLRSEADPSVGVMAASSPTLCFCLTR